MDRLDPASCALFLLLAFASAGVLHAFWLRSAPSRIFQIPIDAGMTIGGKRLLGDNKTWRGFMVMAPATGLMFLFWAAALPAFMPKLAEGLWPLGSSEFALVGFWAGIGFMAGELPNSFVKRRLGIEPGTAPAHWLTRLVCLVADRTDSILGAYLAMWVVVPVPWTTLAYILAIGPGVHLGFSLLLFRFGVKGRLA